MRVACLCHSQLAEAKLDLPLEIFLLALIVIVRMAVTPIPILPLFSVSDSSVGPVFSMPFAKVAAIIMVLVVVPIVVVPVLTVIHPIALILAMTPFFLSFVLLRMGCS